MLHLTYRVRIFILGVLLLITVAGCNSTQRFYVLTPLEEPQDHETITLRDNLAIGLGPIDIPGYLDRPEIMTRVGRNQLALSELDHWALPLKENISVVLAENVPSLLPTCRVITYPWNQSATIDYQVAVEIIRFEVVTGGAAELVARWRILGSDRKTVFTQKKSSFSETVKAADYSAKVSAMNRTLESFSREIAEGIKTLAAKEASRFGISSEAGKEYPLRKR